MQGVILAAGRARNLILGDDGNRYAFTLDEWRGEDAAPASGMRVDFEVRGSAAVDIFPIPDDAPMPPATSSAPPPRPAPSTAPKAPAAEPARPPPSSARAARCAQSAADEARVRASCSARAARRTQSATGGARARASCSARAARCAQSAADEARVRASCSARAARRTQSATGGARARASCSARAARCAQSAAGGARARASSSAHTARCAQSAGGGARVRASRRASCSAHASSRAQSAGGGWGIREGLVALGAGGGRPGRPGHRRRLRPGALRTVRHSHREGDRPPQLPGQHVCPGRVRGRAGDILRSGRARHPAGPGRGHPALLRLEAGPRRLRRRKAGGHVGEGPAARRQRLRRAEPVQRRGVHIRRAGGHRGERPAPRQRIGHGRGARVVPRRGRGRAGDTRPRLRAERPGGQLRVAGQGVGTDTRRGAVVGVGQRDGRPVRRRVGRGARPGKLGARGQGVRVGRQGGGRRPGGRAQVGQRHPDNRGHARRLRPERRTFRVGAVRPFGPAGRVRVGARVAGGGDGRHQGLRQRCLPGLREALARGAVRQPSGRPPTRRVAPPEPPRSPRPKSKGRPRPPPRLSPPSPRRPYPCRRPDNPPCPDASPSSWNGKYPNRAW